ncbi:MAG: PSP1 domain-containing protein [Trueperaceae bacterium]
MPQSIAVKFDNGPKLHYVELNTETVPAVNARVILETRRGLEMGVVRTEPKANMKTTGQFVREASPGDLETYEAYKTRAEELKWLLKARSRGLTKDLKIIAMEFNLDGTLLVVSYSSEAQVPLRQMAGDLMPHTEARIEFVNVGPRDQARMLGTLGVCGDGSCSSRFLQSFSAVGIRMARDQQLPLNPEKISGPCGRLMCCLQYEHEMYEELLRSLPRKGMMACHKEHGTCGRVIKLSPLKQTVDILTEDGSIHEFPATELEVQRGNRRQSEEA